MPVLTVWRSTTAEQSVADKESGAQVEVTAKRPAEGDVLFEIHAPASALVEKSEGVWLFDWSKIDSYPHQITNS